MRKTELVGLEPIQDLIELTLMTPYVKGERIVSLLVVAESESGKTELMKKYRNNRGVHVRRRFSAYGILKDLIQGKIRMRFDKPKILGHINIYDYSSVFSYKQNTVDSTIELLDALTEEGLSEESSYWIRGDELKKFKGLKGGVIAGINTYGFFTAGKKRVKANLYKGGWFSRNIVVSYELSEELASKIHDCIGKGEYRYDKKHVSAIALELPKKRIEIEMPEDLSEQIKDLARNVAEEYSEDLKPHKLRGFRLHKSLISLVKASALRENRKTVNEEDVARIEFLSHWMNLKMHRLQTNYTYYRRHPS
jgi:hypothetical protein